MYKYREELKYILEQNSLLVLESTIACFMEKDKHQNGLSYRIRSLYFDDYYDSAYYENAGGSDNRKKFRIRAYDTICDRINLEVKYKYRGKTRKESCLLNENQVHQIIDGELPFDSLYPKPLMLLYIETCLRRMVPKIIVEYERAAYIYPIGNVRVTFDRNISYSNDIINFFEKRMNLTPLLPVNKHVLEVKYDEFLPDFIAQTLEMGNMERTAFSKYYLSRLADKGESAYEY